MKKITILVALLVACFAGTATAQDAFVPSWTAGIDFRGMFPMGDFGDVSEWGVGGTGYVGYNVAPQVAITGRVGYLYFGGKEYAVTVDDGQGGTIDGKAKAKLHAIPILAGAKFFFSEGDMRMYGAAEAGLFMMGGSAEFNSDDGTVSVSQDLDSESKFGVVPTLGAQFKAGDAMNVDVHVNFTNIFTDPSATNWIGVGIGFEWMLN